MQASTTDSSSVATAIAAWLRDFDSIIDQYGSDPTLIKSDDFLRSLFQRAFPPPNLPERLEFKTKDSGDGLHELADAHHPYYGFKLSTRTRIDAKGKETKSSKLVLKIVKSVEYLEILRSHGLLRDGQQAPRPVLGRRGELSVKPRSRPRDPALKILKLVQEGCDLGAKAVAEIEEDLAAARKRGDARMVALYDRMLAQEKKSAERFTQELERVKKSF